MKSNNYRRRTPNFMKIAPLMRAINAAKAAGKNISARLVYTGSDEDKSLEPSLFTDLDMPRPDAYLRVMILISSNEWQALSLPLPVSWRSILHKLSLW